jgi:hypothetical protein
VAARACFDATGLGFFRAGSSLRPTEAGEDLGRNSSDGAPENTCQLPQETNDLIFQPVREIALLQPRLGALQNMLRCP